MMDQKYLAEIKAFLEAYETALKTNKNIALTRLDMERYAYTGFKALIAKVKHLQEENSALSKDCEEINRSNVIKAEQLIEKNAQLVTKDQQIATLTKALENMYADNKGYNPDGMGNPAWYIQQAQEQEGKDDC